MDRLNAVGRNQFQPAMPIAQMEVGKSYKVTNLRKVNPAHGPAIIVQLKGFGESFLPKRVNKVLLEDQPLFESLISQIKEERLTLTYLGGRYNAVEFA